MCCGIGHKPSLLSSVGREALLAFMRSGPALILFFLLALTPAGTLAQELPNSLVMKCVDAQALVSRAGAVVIASGSNIYERFVANPGFCQSQRTDPAWIPTADSAQCLVGQRCRERRIRVR